MTRPEGYWFPAKRYGWGWGPPRTWQGWLVLGLWFGVLMLVRFASPAVGALVVVLDTAALLAVVAATGERPRWRWGK